MKITDVEAIYVSQSQVRAVRQRPRRVNRAHYHRRGNHAVSAKSIARRWRRKRSSKGPSPHDQHGPQAFAHRPGPFENRNDLAHDVPANDLLRSSRHRLHAMSGIDIALWDIKEGARFAHLELLGGGFQKQIRCYASTLFGATPQATGEIARRIRDRGFGAVQIRWPRWDKTLGPTSIGTSGTSWLRRRRTTDDRRRSGLDARTAIQRAHAFAEFEIAWLEEPLQPDDYVGYRKLTTRVPYISRRANRKVTTVVSRSYGSRGDRHRAGRSHSVRRLHRSG